jgi:hypothetical protein
MNIKRNIYMSAVLAVAALTASCAGFSAYKYRQFYAMVSPVKSFDRHYEDGAVAFQFEISEKKINVRIENNGGEPIEVQWQNARFVDQDGTKHDIANSQTVLTKDSARIKPTTIQAGATEENVVVPVDHQEQLEQWTWYIKPFFNQTDDGALSNLGKTFGINIPLKVGAEERRYSFEFKVTNVVPYTARTPG